MKSNKVLSIIFFLVITVAFGQNINRIEVKGQIIVDSPDLEGVTIFNSSANSGTITDAKGKFTLKVALNDVIEVSALQFEKFTVNVTKEILAAKSMTIFLVEKINKLDEVLILPYGLSGSLQSDLDKTKTVNPNLDALYFGLDNLDKIEFQKDYLTEVENIGMTNTTQYRYGFDVVKVVGTLLKPVFNFKKEKDVIKHQSAISKKYSTQYLLERLSIPKEQIIPFLDYVEDKGLDSTLLEDGKEFEFLNFLIEESKKFQALKTSKQ